MVSIPNNGFFSVANMIVPSEGPKVVPVKLDFSGIDTLEIDGNQIVTQGGIDYIQTVYIDNSNNDEAVSILSDVTGQVITCPAGCQGNFNVFMPNNPKFSVTTTGAVIITIFFCNFPLIPAVWSASSAGAASNVIVDSGQLDGITDPILIDSTTPIDVQFSEAAVHYEEVSLTLDGTDQELLAAGDAAIAGAVIANLVGNNPITVNLAGGDATLTGIVLNAGGTITLDAVTNAINVSGTNTEDVVAYIKAV